VDGVLRGSAPHDTRSDAADAARWATARGYRSLRVVTSPWHLPRTLAELRRRLPGTILHPDPAAGPSPTLAALAAEYAKLWGARLHLPPSS